MEHKTRESILNLIEEEDVEFIRLQFTDMFGTLKNIAVTAGQMEKALDGKCWIEGLAVHGFDKDDMEQLFLYPDLTTFSILPWRPQQGKVARLLCDVCYADGKPVFESSRYILKRVVEEAEKEGYTFFAEPECEFFLFHTDDNGIPTTTTHEKAGYMDLSPLDLGENARRDMVLTLEDMDMTSGLPIMKRRLRSTRLIFAAKKASVLQISLSRLRLRCELLQNGTDFTPLLCQSQGMTPKGQACIFGFFFGKTERMYLKRMEALARKPNIS